MSSAGTVVLTPKSSDVSNSESPVGESEGNGAIGSGREMTSMERSRTHSSGATPALRKEMSLTLEQDELMEDGLPSHRPRKGHKKSRGGCYNCKRRKIKCQENQPACRNCTRKNLDCKYPAPKTLSALQGSAQYSASPIMSVNLQVTPTVFTLTDMRLFHHYLLDAYPHLPVGNDTAWLSQVPLVAHHNEYLMHAILGLAASHLELLTGSDLSAQAIHHRVLAIKGSNNALQLKSRTGSDGDALLAACYLLTFQSSYMKDGIHEFFQFVRGCALLSNQLREEKVPMAFFLTSNDHFNFMEKRLIDLPAINEELLECAERSLGALPGYFEVPVHEIFYTAMVVCLEAVKVSSLHGYFKFIFIYQSLNRMSNDLFRDFIDPENAISRILIAHFLAIQLIMLPILDREWAGRTKNTPARMNLAWMTSIYESSPTHLRHLVEWPQAVAEAVRDELAGKQSNVPRVPILQKKAGFSRDVVYGVDSVSRGALFGR
ncbi:hypothetical protein IFR04_014924 [Cadophora malorum]|uniref:Zn(2)-C6 fungal-type domain-containing protein n=1 Tax=Cadophora malorum TaxID=108018 RepID=A0A8H7T3V1_9HELO|nr:hypothetical protein IFR04_014924 [Cadophora malorum]